MFCEKAARLFAGFIHFATGGFTEGSLLHHGVRNLKRWNITAGEVQFLGHTAVAKVKFLGTVAAKLQLLEPGQALDAAGGPAGADLVSRCFGGTEGPPRAGFEPGRSSRPKWTSSTCAVTG